ncbi:hypothetical protein IAR50_000567 [Cryptococcus sp. DSM 104548]
MPPGPPRINYRPVRARAARVLKDLRTSFTPTSGTSLKSASATSATSRQGQQTAGGQHHIANIFASFPQGGSVVKRDDSIVLELLRVLDRDLNPDVRFSADEWT